MSFQNLKTPGAMVPQAPEDTSLRVASLPQGSHKLRNFVAAAAITMGGLVPGVAKADDRPAPGGPAPSPGAPAPATEKGKLTDLINNGATEASKAVELLQSGKATPTDVTNARNLLRSLTIQSNVLEKKFAEFVPADVTRYAELVKATEDLRELLKSKSPSPGPAVPSGVPSAAPGSPAPGGAFAPPAPAAPRISAASVEDAIAQAAANNPLGKSRLVRTNDGGQRWVLDDLRADVLKPINDPAYLNQIIADGKTFGDRVRHIVAIQTVFSQNEAIEMCRAYIAAVPAEKRATLLNIDADLVRSTDFLKEPFKAGGIFSGVVSVQRPGWIELKDGLSQADLSKAFEQRRAAGDDAGMKQILALREQEANRADEAMAKRLADAAAKEDKRKADMDAANAARGLAEDKRVAYVHAVQELQLSLEIKRTIAMQEALGRRAAAADQEKLEMQNRLAARAFEEAVRVSGIRAVQTIQSLGEFGRQLAFLTENRDLQVSLNNLAGIPYAPVIINGTATPQDFQAIIISLIGAGVAVANK